MTPFACIVPNEATRAVLSSPNLSVIYLKIAGLSDSTQSISMSPISFLSSLQNREKTVCHTSGFKSIMSATYATLEPPTLPRAVPIAIPCDLHQQISSDMESIKPSICSFWKTRISSSIAERNAASCSLGITPLSSFSRNLRSTVSMNFCESASREPYRIGYLIEVSSSMSSVISYRRFVFSIAVI